MFTLLARGGGAQVIYYQMIDQVYFIKTFLGFIYPSNIYNPINPPIVHLPSLSGRPPRYFWRHITCRHTNYYYLRCSVLCHLIQNPIRDPTLQIIKLRKWRWSLQTHMPLSHCHMENRIFSRIHKSCHTQSNQTRGMGTAQYHKIYPSLC